uniref:Neogenin-like isoform X3 n=1 Tax=Crassostrea virginica TaxID=6565 RepID=A0A8B8C6T1_CRAVI|nr:neogenin-like isoform X3 [Crassostrea virginica]
MRRILVAISVLLGICQCSLGPYRYLSTPKHLQADFVPSEILPDQYDVNLTWPEVHHKKSWKPLIYTVKQENLADSSAVTSETGVNTFTAKGLEKDKSYVFYVKARQGWLQSDWSRSVHVTISTPPIIYKDDIDDDDPKHPRPRGLKVKYISPISFKLKWRDPKDAKTLKVKGYRVTWKRKKGQTYKSDLITKRSFSIKKLRPDSTYLFRVQIVYENKVSKSLTLFCKTQKEFGVQPPANFKTKAIGSTKIRLSWTPRKDSVTKVTGYKIQYKRRGVRRGDICSSVARPWKSNYVITDLLKGETYKVRIAATSQYTTGSYSPWRVVKLPGERKESRDTAANITSTSMPTPSPKEMFNLKIGQIKGGVNITWDDISSEVVTYMVEITQDSQILYIKEVYGDPRVLEVYSLDPGEEFNVTVRGDSSGEPVSVTSSFQTPVPVSVVTEGPHVTLVGGNLTLRCIVEGTPQPQYDWLLGQGFTQYDITAFEEDSFNKYLLLLELYNIPEDFRSPSCRAQNALENVTQEHTISVIGLIPPTIENVTAVVMSSRKVAVEWVSSIEHEYLNVTYIVTIEDVTGSYRIDEEEKTNRHVFRNLTENTEYRVYVVAVTATGQRSSRSDVISVETDKALPKPTLQAISLNETMISLNWFTNSDREPDLFKVFYKRESNRDFRVRKTYPPITSMVLQEMQPPTPPADAFLMVNHTSLTVRWLPPHSEYGTKIRQYRLDIYQGDELQSLLVDSKGRNYTLIPFDDTKEAAVYLTAINNAGASDPILRTYKPLADDDSPEGSVGNLRGKPLSPNTVLVEWEPPTNKRLARFLFRFRPLEYNDSNIIDKWLGPSLNNYVLNGLKGAESYFISVIPYFNEEVGNDSSIVVRTLHGPPAAPPQNVTISYVNFTEITLQWSPPPEGLRNGALTEYVVSFRPEDKSKDSTQYSNNSRAVIRDLLPNTVYYVRVAASTLNGTGPYSDWQSVTTPKLPVVREPPSPPEDFTTKQVPYGITLQWQRPMNPEVPVNGYIVGYGRFIPEVYREILGDNKLQYTIHKLRQNHDYLVSVRAFNSFGESDPVITVARAGDGRMRLDPPLIIDKEEGLGQFDDAPQNVSLELNRGEIPTVNVRWFPPAQLQGPSLGYNVFYKKENKESWVVKFADRSTFLVLKNLSFDTTYYVRVNVRYEDDVRAKLSRTAVIKTFSLEDTIHALPTPSITSVFSGPNFLDVNWKPPLKDYLHVIVGFILGFGIREANEHQEFIPASQRSFRINNLQPGTEYLISLAMFNEHGRSAKFIVKASTLDGQKQGHTS